jgi:hypothetical protein
VTEIVSMIISLYLTGTADQRRFRMVGWFTSAVTQGAVPLRRIWPEVESSGRSLFAVMSEQPVLEPQPGHSRKVTGVAGQKRCVVSKGNAGNFQVHRSNAHAFSSKTYKQIGGIRVPREYIPSSKELDTALQPVISNDLAMRIGEAMDFSQPAAQLLFDCYDGGGSILARSLNALQQRHAGCGRRTECRDVVCIKNQQFLCRSSAVSDTRGQGVLLPASSRHRAWSQQCFASLYWRAAN